MQFTQIQMQNKDLDLTSKARHRDFPGGTMDKNAQCWGHGFNPWPRKIPQAVEQLSPCATTTEPKCCKY